MKYHLHSYAAPAAASIATGEAVRPLLVRYVGSSCVFLLVLGLFNIGRSLGRGSAIAGAIAALLVVFPIDPAELFGAPALSLRASIRLYGVHLSTTQLMGHVYLAALLLLVSWSFRGLRARDHWPLALLAFAGAGSKAMFGPVIVCGALGVGAWQAVVNRRFDRHAWALAALLAAGVAPAVVPLLIGESSYATTAVLTYSAFAQRTPFFEALVPPLPVAVAASAWVLGFTLWSLVGGVGAIRARAEAGDATRFIVFAWMCFLASLVPTLATELGGHSQLFFLYFGDAALASVAGFGWVTLASRVARPLRSGGRARTLKLGSALAALLLLLLGGRALGLRIPPRLADPETNLIWYRTQWMEAAGMKPYLDASLPDPELEYYWKRLDFTEDHRRALSWMREQWQGDCVFAVNVVSASPYAGHSECRAILETWRFHVLAHQLDQAGLERHFRKRLVALAAWRDDRPNAAELLRSVGVTHVFHDRIAGTPRSALGTVVFDSPGFAIYSLSDPEAAPGAAAR
jgi:hypothetical protein